VLAIIPFGYMSNVLGSSGRKLTTFSMHGVNRMVTLFAGLLLITQYRRRLAFSCKFTTSSTRRASSYANSSHRRSIVVLHLQPRSFLETAVRPMLMSAMKSEPALIGPIVMGTFNR
jgi:hypothetical protein